MTSRFKTFLVADYPGAAGGDQPAGVELAVQRSACAGDLPERLHTPSVRIVDRNGRLYEALDEQGGRHVVVPLETIPLACRQAAIATEDRRFYSIPVWTGRDATGGLDQPAAVRPLPAAARSPNRWPATCCWKAERGERSLRRKLREAVLAWRLTRASARTKSWRLYLNQTYYGGMAYGLEAAAQTFFGKPAPSWTWPNAPCWPACPRRPPYITRSPISQAAKLRQQVVLA